MIKKVGLYAFVLFVLMTLPNTHVVIAVEQNEVTQACFERACVVNEFDNAKKPSVFEAVKRQFFAPKDDITLNPELVFNLINAYRTKKGLPAFEKDENLCSIAKSREPELMGEIFGGKGIHSGFRARHLPYWATENMKYGGDENDVFNWWLSSPIHHKAIIGDSKYSCTACSGRACIALFTSYIPK